MYVSTLVADHFVPNPKNHRYVIHKDGDWNNNAASNLEWVAFGGVIAHKVKKHRTVYGMKVHSAVLTENDVREIRHLAALSLSYGDLGKTYGVSRTTISSIARRKTWRRVR
jgi:hypothetical protein